MPGNPRTVYNPADQSFLSMFENKTNTGLVIEDNARFHVDPRNRTNGRGPVVAPRNTNEVALILAACHQNSVAVVPYGGGTGLVGGQIYDNPCLPLVVSLHRMNKIRDVHIEENTLIAEAGATITAVQDTAQSNNRLYPLSLTSEGTATVGGTLSTNAGGVNVLRYGNARAQCLGVEFVTADGKIWNGLTRLRKDNTGYDLRDMVIGAEGSLGIITAAALRLSPRPTRFETALLVTDNPNMALSSLSALQGIVGDCISAFELIHSQGVKFLQETQILNTFPIDPLPNWSVLVELGHFAHADILPDALADLLNAGLISDAVIANSDLQRQSMWAIREQIPEANRKIGSIASHDIALPLSQIAAFIEDTGPEIKKIGPFRINSFGHLGDGNLHYNIFAPYGETPQSWRHLAPAITDIVHSNVHKRGGSISAEHGIGRFKTNDLEQFCDPTKHQMMKAIKAAFDPTGIMNPGVILRNP